MYNFGAKLCGKTSGCMGICAEFCNSDIYDNNNIIVNKGTLLAIAVFSEALKKWNKMNLLI